MKKFLLLLFPILCFGQFNPIFFIGGSSIPQVNPGTTNLIAYYKLDNDAVDASGLSPTGTTTGVDYVTGIQGNAARFDAGTDRIDVSDSDNFSFTNGTNDLPFSISMWVYFTAFNTGNNYLINKRGTTTDCEWLLATESASGNLVFQKFSQGVNTVTQSIRSVVPSLSSWNFIVITDDGSGTVSGMNIYVNGTLRSKTNISVGTYVRMNNGASITRIGLNSYSITDATRAHQGYINNIGVWKNRVLTASEIRYLYNTGTGRAYPF